MLTISDNQIITNLKAGDEKVFELLFKGYFNRLTSFAFEYVADRDIAKNMVQDTFVALWNKREDLDEAINVNAWLYTTVKFHCMNYLRGLKSAESYKKNAALTWQEASLNYHTLSELNTSELLFKEIELIIDDTLKQLPEQCRKVFILSRFENKKNREIAEELDISIKTVEAHMSKALKVMRVALRDYLPFVAYLLYSN